MLLKLLGVTVLVLLNGFFVGAEFALVRSRRTRLQAMARNGDKQAGIALKAIGNIARLLSASQLGVTVSSLGLGWVAEEALGHSLDGWFATLPVAIEVPLRVTIASMVALIAVTYLHVVFGELAPKAAALRHPERLARWLAPPLMAFAWVATPFTALLSRSSSVVLRAFGVRPQSAAEESVHSPEELRLLVEQAQELGALERPEADLIEGVFEFSEKNAREVMTPRTEIVAIPLEATLDETAQIVTEGGFSRYPVYEETIDNIVGILLAKDLLAVFRHPPEHFHVADILRDVHVVPGSREVEDVLADFKRQKEHMAVVLDEFGGTAGLVTMEDLLEEIVGEILDEYDEPEPPAPVAGATGELVVAGDTHIGEINELHGLDVPEEDYTTIGGYVFGALGRLPTAGDRVRTGVTTFVVRKMDGRRIDTLAIVRDDGTGGKREEKGAAG